MKYVFATIEYSKFLDYAFPAFGICVLAAVLVWLPIIIFYRTKQPPDWMMWTVMSITTFSIGAAVLIGWLLPWGSPF